MSARERLIETAKDLLKTAVSPEKINNAIGKAKILSLVNLLKGNLSASKAKMDQAGNITQGLNKRIMQHNHGLKLKDWSAVSRSSDLLIPKSMFTKK